MPIMDKGSWNNCSISSSNAYVGVSLRRNFFNTSCWKNKQIMTIINRSVSRRIVYNFPISCQIPLVKRFSDSTSGRSESKSSDSVDSRDEPIKFSTSAAFRHKRPFQQFKNNTNLTASGQQSLAAIAGNPRLANMRLYEPWFHNLQEFTVLASMVIFLIYFGILREENDIDEELGRPLHERIPQMEMGILKDRIMLGKMQDEDVSKYEKRLQELENKITASKIRKS
uniref:Uncharacterized protein n=1 Tax=Romanomermis culicivorax TaxID=13658 RepID=A0A915JCZ7_ROMCU